VAGQLRAYDIAGASPVVGQRIPPQGPSDSLRERTSAVGQRNDTISGRIAGDDRTVDRTGQGADDMSGFYTAFVQRLVDARLGRAGCIFPASTSTIRRASIAVVTKGDPMLRRGRSRPTGGSPRYMPR
jgi:hypothetical protein